MRMTKAKKIIALFLMIACIAAGTLIGYHMGTEAGSTQAANEKDDPSDGDTQTETEPAETGQSETDPTGTEPAETEPAENGPAETEQTDMSGDLYGGYPMPASSEGQPLPVVSHCKRG